MNKNDNNTVDFVNDFDEEYKNFKQSQREEKQNAKNARFCFKLFTFGSCFIFLLFIIKYLWFKN